MVACLLLNENADILSKLLLQTCLLSFTNSQEESVLQNSQEELALPCKILQKWYNVQGIVFQLFEDTYMTNNKISVIIWYQEDNTEHIFVVIVASITSSTLTKIQFKPIR